MEEMSGVVRTRVTAFAAIAALAAMLTVAGGVSAGDKPSEEQDPVALMEIEDELVAEVETIEKSFVTFIDALEKRFTGELENVEGQLSGIIAGLEQAPMDEKLMAEVDTVKARLGELAAAVEQLKQKTEFLDSGSADAIDSDIRPIG